MKVCVEAIYENGVLRPLEPLSLAESQQVTVTISEQDPERAYRNMEIVEMARRELAGLKRVPTIEEVRDALSAIPGSLSDDIIAERGDY
jgi:predicted DNA-binding antitoxin AbrB/MazE fold protein